MQSLDADFHELLDRIHYGRELGHAGFEPVYYLIFPPSKILEVKRQMPAWTAKLKNKGWAVHTFSISDNITAILENAPLRKIWIKADERSPADWEKTNQSLANALNSGSLQSLIEKKLGELESIDNAILLVTDLEGLHPYMRIGALEQQLQGQFNSPAVFFYPGKRTGKTQLKFLNFYPDDGNYRSVHVGG